MVKVRNNRRQSDRRNSKGFNLYIRNLFSKDRRKIEREKQSLMNKDFITWLICVFSSFAILSAILVASYMRG
tara:strand:+ start:910 stop:1125 length:216 start_codon:yes stop_codon:yes gene_type:complete